MARNDIDGLVQERRNSIANALELRLSCTKPSITNTNGYICFLKTIQHVTTGNDNFVMTLWFCQEYNLSTTVILK